ncbi:uncharacterized protein LOC126656797 [Mercurialis annua]|uniref:uncharacterized protein LOC126656797 n=1 Tax=Mercurialis annua TaxID=3986 RepID=UPI0021604958|nr:uncharacterized protein LOC126656797 [Mercurialis annua]
MSLSALPGNYSDHVPLLFRSANAFDCGPKPFRSVDAWWEHEGFKKFVSDSWITACEKSSDLTSRLKELRLSIKGWNQNVFGDQNKRIQELSEEIFRKEALVDVNMFSEDERMVIGDLKADLWAVEKRIQSINNLISSIQVEEATYTNPSDIRGYIRDFFKSLYRQQNGINFDLSRLVFEKITEEQATGLIRQFSEEEIFKAPVSCGERKASGPDGFNFYFYRRAWRFMKDVIQGFFEDFHSSNFLPKGINTSFMVLIPKMAGSANIKDYRPISLVNGFFKLLSKTLSLRLAPLLTKVISESQHAFLKGRSVR